MPDVDVSELNRLVATFTSASIKAAPLARLVVQKACADTKRDAQMFCPVDTGFLRNSITYETRTLHGGAAGEVGPTASYGIFVEFGTSRHGPQAFMGPAFDRHAGTFEQAIGQIADLVL